MTWSAQENYSRKCNNIYTVNIQFNLFSSRLFAEQQRRDEKLDLDRDLHNELLFADTDGIFYRRPRISRIDKMIHREIHNSRRHIFKVISAPRKPAAGRLACLWWLADANSRLASRWWCGTGSAAAAAVHVCWCLMAAKNTRNCPWQKK